MLLKNLKVLISIGAREKYKLIEINVDSLNTNSINVSEFILIWKVCNVILEELLQYETFVNDIF